MSNSTDPIRTRVEVPHNDAPGLHDRWRHGRTEIRVDRVWWLVFHCNAGNCPGRLLVRESDIEQMVNDAMKETT